MEEGEYIDFSEASQTYLSEKVGTVHGVKRHQNAKYSVDEVFEIDITKETLLETETNMQSNTSKFYSKFKGKMPKPQV